MFCDKCAQLATNPGSFRICVRCQGRINENLSCICETCANEQKVCSACLKNLIQIPTTTRDCGCGKKK